MGTQIGNTNVLVTALEKSDQVNHMIENIMECRINFKDLSKSVSVLKGETDVLSLNIHLCLQYVLY